MTTEELKSLIVREEVVEGIIQSFLSVTPYRFFKPYGDILHPNKPTKFISRHKGAECFYGFTQGQFGDDENIRFNSEELNEAIRRMTDKDKDKDKNFLYWFYDENKCPCYFVSPYYYYDTWVKDEEDGEYNSYFNYAVQIELGEGFDE